MWSNKAPWQKKGREPKTRVVNNVDKKSRDYLFLERIRALEEKLAKARTPHTRLQYSNDLAREKHALWDCYEKLVIRMKFELIALCNRHKFDLGPELDEYDSRAYEKFERVVEMIDMKKWYPLRKKALIYCSLWGYLSSMNRDLVEEYINRGKSTVRITPFLGIGNDDAATAVTNLDVHCAEHYRSMEDETFRGIVQQVFAETMRALEARMKPHQLEMWRLKKEGATATAICAQYHVKPKDFKAFVTNATDEFKKLVPRVSARLGNRMSYEEMVQELAA